MSLTSARSASRELPCLVLKPSLLPSKRRTRPVPDPSPGQSAAASGPAALGSLCFGGVQANPQQDSPSQSSAPAAEGASGAHQPPPEPPRPRKLPVNRCWGSKLPITAPPSLRLCPECPRVWAAVLPGCCLVNAKGYAVTYRQWHVQTEQRQQHGYALGSERPGSQRPPSLVTQRAVSSLTTWE